MSGCNCYCAWFSDCHPIPMHANLILGTLHMQAWQCSPFVDQLPCSPLVFAASRGSDPSNQSTGIAIRFWVSDTRPAITCRGLVLKQNSRRKKPTDLFSHAILSLQSLGSLPCSKQGSVLSKKKKNLWKCKRSFALGLEKNAILGVWEKKKSSYFMKHKSPHISEVTLPVNLQCV